MEDPDGAGEALRQLIIEEIKKCADTDLLDLVYKLLTT
jgi:hypothetical protein